MNRRGKQRREKKKRREDKLTEKKRIEKREQKGKQTYPHFTLWLSQRGAAFDM